MRELAHNHRPERTWNWTRENYCVHAEIPPLLSDNKLQEEKKTTNCYSISESTHTHQLQRWTGKMQDFLFQFFVCFFNEEKWRKKTKRSKKNLLLYVRKYAQLFKYYLHILQCFLSRKKEKNTTKSATLHRKLKCIQNVWLHFIKIKCRRFSCIMKLQWN